MRHIIVATIALTLCTLPLTAAAEAPEGKAAAAADDGAKGSAKERILGALDLPLKAQALRKAGADEKEVKGGLKVAKEKKLKAKDAAELIGEAAKATKEHGPVDNFGAFVQSKLDAGLRGKDLAEAIRQEHAAKGKGKGKGEGKGEGKGPDEAKGHGEGKGPDEAKGEGKGPDEAKGEGKGPDEAKGPDGAGGPPDGKGPPEGKGPEGEGKGQPDEAKADDKGGKPDDKGGKPEGKGGKPDDKGKGK